MQFGISEDITPRWSRKNLVVRKQELGVGRGQKSEHDVCLLVFLQRTVGQGGDLKACLWGSHGKRVPAGVQAVPSAETELGAPLGTSQVTRILPGLHLSQMRLSWGRRSKNSH